MRLTLAITALLIAVAATLVITLGGEPEPEIGTALYCERVNTTLIFCKETG